MLSALHLFFSCISSLLNLKGTHDFQKQMYGKKILFGVNVPFPQTVWSQPLRNFVSIIWSITQSKKLRNCYQRLRIGFGLQAWNLSASTAVLWCQYWVKEFMCNLALSSYNNLTWTNKPILPTLTSESRNFILCLCSCRTFQRSFIAWNHCTSDFHSILIFVP